ncbi:MAG: hypothetical protein KGK08_02435 [Acidobacteriota bacterium]|nr:hypothetical protein [Acidobacteriota bacterium]
MNTLHMDPSLVRAISIALALVLLYGSRVSTGKARATAAGLAFPIKPLYAWSRAVALPLYILFFAWYLHVETHHTPWWIGLIFLAALAIGLVPLPGTITLTPTGLTQHFWLFPTRTIPYRDIVAVQTLQRGRTIRVLTTHGLSISHSANHAAAARFLQELQQRSGKPPLQ